MSHCRKKIPAGLNADILVKMNQAEQLQYAKLGQNGFTYKEEVFFNDEQMQLLNKFEDKMKTKYGNSRT